MQSEAAFKLPRQALAAAEVVTSPDRRPVLPDQRRDDVNMVFGVTNRHPPRPARVVGRRHPDRVDELGRNRAPLLVRQDRIRRMVVHRAVPDRPSRRPDAGDDGLFQQPRQPTHRNTCGQAQRGRAANSGPRPGADQPRRIVLALLTWAEQITEKITYARAAGTNPADHDRLSSPCSRSANSSTRSTAAAQRPASSTATALTNAVRTAKRSRCSDASSGPDPGPPVPAATRAAATVTSPAYPDGVSRASPAAASTCWNSSSDRRTEILRGRPGETCPRCRAAGVSTAAPDHAERSTSTPGFCTLDDLRPQSPPKS